MTKTRLAIALIALMIWTAVTIVLGNIIVGREIALLDAVTRGVGWAWLIAAVFILAVVMWRGWRDVGLDRLAEPRLWRLTWLPMLYIVGALAMAAVFGLPPATVLLLILLNTFFVGFSEELMFRGALLQAFRHATSIWPAVLLTSVAFGAIHSLNVFVTGDLKAALIQSAAAFLSGIVFIALRLRTGSLWPSIVVHALWDFATFTLGAATKRAGEGLAATQASAQPSDLMVFLPVLLVLPNAIYGFWLMWDIARTHADPEK
jgi:membrane protease YdiL (CAAX protease family)